MEIDPLHCAAVVVNGNLCPGCEKKKMQGANPIGVDGGGMPMSVWASESLSRHSINFFHQ